MTTPPHDPLITARLERLIGLIEVLLDRRSDSAIGDRLDQVIEELGRIQAAMTAAAITMQDVSPQIAQAVTWQDLRASEDRTCALIERLIAEQRATAEAVAHLIQMLGLAPGREQTG